MSDNPDILDKESDEESFGNFVSPELENIFHKPYCLDREEAITLSKNYILYLSGAHVGSEQRVALGMSSGESCVYSIGPSLVCTSTIPAESSSIVNVRFAPDDPSLLYVGSSNGTISLWDLRDTNKFSRQYKDTSDPKKNNRHDKMFCSFDVSSNGRFLCAGSEVTDGEAFLLFWDTRQDSVLGGYWESHTDDITQVSFHPSEPDRVITGSTDGLINLFDISQTDENEALIQSFNTESSVEKLRWHPGTSDMVVSCVTHTADVQLWHVDDSAPFISFDRTDIATTLQMNTGELSDTLYFADVHTVADDGSLLFLAGSNIGNGRCLRSAVYSSNGKLSPQSYFDGNKQIVRCSLFDPQNELLITGGEAGILSVWKPGNNPSPNSLKASMKIKEKPHKNKKVKPY